MYFDEEMSSIRPCERIGYQPAPRVETNGQLWKDLKWNSIRSSSLSMDL